MEAPDSFWRAPVVIECSALAAANAAAGHRQGRKRTPSGLISAKSAGVASRDVQRALARRHHARLLRLSEASKRRCKWRSMRSELCTSTHVSRQELLGKTEDVLK